MSDVNWKDLIAEVDVLIGNVQNFKSDYAGKLDAVRERLDEIELRENRRGLGGGPPDRKGETQEQLKLLSAGYLALVNGDQQKANAALSEYKAMGIGSDPGGGYFVDPYRSGTMLRVMAEIAPFIAEARTINLRSGDGFEEMLDLYQASGAWVGEDQARPDTATPDIGKYYIPVHERYAMPKVTQKLVDCAEIDIIEYLNSKVAEDFAVNENIAYVKGDGILKPRGITAYDTVATPDSSRAWGTLEHIKTGANGAFAATSPADCLFDLTSALRPIYRSNARWMMSRSTANEIRKFKEATTNAYIWQPGLQQGVPDRLLGYPVMYAEEMPARATNSLSVAFGDFRKGYTIVRKPGIKFLVDPFTDKPNVRLYAYERVGGGVADFNAIKLLKFAA